MTAITDIHTHAADGDLTGRIVCLDPVETPEPRLEPGVLYSVGIHPWNAHRYNDSHVERLRRLAADPRVVAVGECGLDRNAAASDSAQLPLFSLQARLAEEVGKPLIIHLVGRLSELLALRRSLGPSVPWIVHGFRGKAQTARQIVDAGMYISLGERFNAEAAALIPAERLLLETDCSTLSPAQIAALHSPERAAAALNNAARIFSAPTA